MVELVPELEFLIGKQPAVPELPPQEAQNRFKLAFRRFIGAFATPEHPLALFLDDLQWLDAATLDLSSIWSRRGGAAPAAGRRLSGQRGRCRSPAFARAGGDPASGREGENRMAPLGPTMSTGSSPAPYIATERARPLAQLVHEKTGGNPFFANQFFTGWPKKGAGVRPRRRGWRWDLDRIRAKNYTGNVVDLMVVKLNRLPAETEAALRQLACIGARCSVRSP